MVILAAMGKTFRISKSGRALFEIEMETHQCGDKKQKRQK